MPAGIYGPLDVRAEHLEHLRVRVAALDTLDEIVSVQFVRDELKKSE